MLLFPIAALVGLAVGYALGGRLRALAGLHLRARALVWGALGAQLALYAPGARALPGPVQRAIVVASFALVGAWLVVNARRATGALRAAFALVALGWALNVAVVVPNGGMPVSAAALREAGAPPSLDVEEGHLWKHVAADGSTVLPWLGDVIPVRAANAVVSVGDIVLALGFAAVIAVAMRGSEPRSGEADPDDGGEGRRPSAVATA